MDEDEIKYLFFDNILFNQNIFHEFFFEPIKNSKPTGDYRIVGAVYHRGDYYHRRKEGHKHNCKGEFMTIVYKKAKKWIKYHQANVEIVDIE
jgi:hypothetical protein